MRRDPNAAARIRSDIEGRSTGGDDRGGTAATAHGAVIGTVGVVCALVTSSDDSSFSLIALAMAVADEK
jgi:hypothetical protein